MKSNLEYKFFEILLFTSVFLILANIIIWKWSRKIISEVYRNPENFKLTSEASSIDHVISGIKTDSLPAPVLPADLNEAQSENFAESRTTTETESLSNGGNIATSSSGSLFPIRAANHSYDNLSIPSPVFESPVVVHRSRINLDSGDVVRRMTPEFMDETPKSNSNTTKTVKETTPT